MGSGVLLAALVVLWFVVLVPMVVTRGDAASARAGRTGRGRTLQRRPAARPLVHAATERVAVNRSALRTSGELRTDVHAVRRRTLAGLVGLALLTLVGALAYRSWLWAPQVLLDIAVVGYLVIIRGAAVRERRYAARRRARLAARPAVQRPDARPAPARPGADRAAPAGPAPARPARAPVADRPAERPAVAVVAPARHPSAPLAPVHPIRRAPAAASGSTAASSWEQGAVVGLDDDDIGFADIEVYRPRTAVG